MHPLQISNSNNNIVDVENKLLSSEEPISLVHSNDDVLKQKPIPINDVSDDQTVHTLSRKTSTASECTTMSDYTPENTITSSTTSSPPTTSIFQNVLSADVGGLDDGMILIDNPTMPRSSPILPNQFAAVEMSSKIGGMPTDRENSNRSQLKIENNNVVSTSPGSAPASVAAPLKDLEAATTSPNKTQPARKISRFLVSPAILTVTNEKAHISPTEEVSTPTLTQAPVQFHTTTTEQVSIEQRQIETNISQMTSTSSILSVDPKLSGKIAEFMSSVQSDGGTPFINPTEILAQTNTLDAKEFIQQQLKKPLGPDHINTLEQLKIELENITHAHMMTKFFAESETFNMVNAAHLSPEMILQHQVDANDFYQSQGQPIHDPFVFEQNNLQLQQQQQQLLQSQLNPENSLPFVTEPMTNVNEPYLHSEVKKLSQQSSIENTQEQ